MSTPAVRRQAERTEKKDFDGRTEFSYGSFVRTVSLAAGADEVNYRSHLRQRDPHRLAGGFTAEAGGAARSDPVGQLTKDHGAQ